MRLGLMVGIGLSLAGPGCSRAEPPPAEATSTSTRTEPVRLRWDRLPLLIAVARTASTATVAVPAGADVPDTVSFASPPDAYLEAMQLWRTATTAVTARDPNAGALFLGVARTLEAGPSHPHRGAFRAGRCMAYENAGRVWAASDPGEAAQRLARILDADPGCRRSLARLIGRLKPAQREGAVVKTSTRTGSKGESPPAAAGSKGGTPPAAAGSKGGTPQAAAGSKGGTPQAAAGSKGGTPQAAAGSKGVAETSTRTGT
jgi:hypothetical protein